MGLESWDWLRWVSWYNFYHVRSAVKWLLQSQAFSAILDPHLVVWTLYSCCYIMVWLVVWNIWIIFPYIGNVIIPTDFHIVQRGGTTTNQFCYACRYPEFSGTWTAHKKRGCQGDGSRMSEDMLKSCLALNGVDCMSPTWTNVNKKWPTWTALWFQTFVIFHNNIWDNPSHWLSYVSRWLLHHQAINQHWPTIINTCQQT